MLSPIFNYFCAFTAFILLPNIYISAIHKIPTRVSNAGAGAGYTFYPHSIINQHFVNESEKGKDDRDSDKGSIIKIMYRHILRTTNTAYKMN